MVETAPCRARRLQRPADRWEEGPFAERFRCRPHRAGRFGLVDSEDPARRCSRRCPGRAIHRVGLILADARGTGSERPGSRLPGLRLRERGPRAWAHDIRPGEPPAGQRRSTPARVTSSKARGSSSFARLIPRAGAGIRQAPTWTSSASDSDAECWGADRRLAASRLRARPHSFGHPFGCTLGVP